MSQASPAKEQWRDRKIETRRMRVGDILPHPNNTKIHGSVQTEPLKGLLREVGKLDDLKAYYSERNGGKLTFFDGHGRQGLDIDQEWDVDIYDLSDREADLAVAAFDPIAYLAQQDREKLDSLLHDVSTGESAIQEMLAGLARQNQLYEIGGDDPRELWKGMPEFEQEDKTAYQSIHIHFKRKDDVEAFSRLVNQTITDRTRAIWYPQAEKIDMVSEHWGDES